MFGDQFMQPAAPVAAGDAAPEDGLRVRARFETPVGVEDERHAAGHAGAEIVADRAQDDRLAAGHVFAAVRAAALDDGDGAGIAHAEPLARLPGGEQFARRGAVEDGVADDRVLVRRQRAGGRGADDDLAAGKPLADIVVGVAEHLQLQPPHRPGAERLAGRAAQPRGNVAGLQFGHAEAARDHRRQPGADGPLRVADVVGELHLLAVGEQRARVLDHLRVQRVGHLVAPRHRAGPPVRAGVGLDQQRVQVQVVEMGRAAAHLVQQVGPPDHVLERARAEAGEDLPHLLGEEAEQVDHLLRRAREPVAQFRVLRAHPHRAGVGVALADHDAPHGDQGRGADAVFLGAEQRRDRYVAAGLQAAVDAQLHAVPQPVQRQHLVDLGEADFPRHSGVADRALRARAGAAAMARDEDRVGVRLGDPGGDGADAGARHQFHADPRRGVDLLEVVDQLRQVLDRIDVVVRRRRDQRHPRRRMAQPGDVGGHLEARQLAALAGLGALRHLDLDLLAVVQVVGGDAEAARSHLLDRRTGVVAVGVGEVALGAFAAFAGIRLGADAVHGDRQRLVRLRRQRAERDPRRHQAAADVGDRLHFLQRRRLGGAAEIEEVAHADGRQLRRALGVAAVGGVGIVRHRVLEDVDQLAVEGVRLAAVAVAVEAAHRQRRRALGEGAAVALQNHALDPRQADAGDARRHSGEEPRHQRPRQAERLEIVAAAIGAQHRDAHLRHDLEDSVVHGLLVGGERLRERHAGRQPAAVAVGDGLLRQIGVDGGGADADEHGEIMHVEALGAAHVDRGVGAQVLADQVRMRAARRQDHGDGGAAGPRRLVGEDQVFAAAAHRVLGGAADGVDGLRQRVRARRGVEGAVDGVGAVAHVEAHRGELAIGQHRRVQLQEAGLVRRAFEDVAEIAEPGLQRHHPAFAQGVDRRVGDLAEILPKEVVQAAVAVGEHRHRRVVAHGPDGLLAVLHHRAEDQFDLLQRPSEQDLEAAQRIGRQRRLLAGAVLDDAVERQDRPDPFAVGPPGGDQVLQLGVAVELPGAKVHGDGLAGAEPPLLDRVGFPDRHHAGFGADDQQAVAGHGVTHRPEAVAVHAADDPGAVGGGDRRRPVPRLHDAIGVTVERAVGLGDRLALLPRFRDHQHLRLGRAAPGPDQYLEHGVEGGGIRTAVLDDRLDVLHPVAERRRLHARLVRLGPVDVAEHGVDLAVVGERAERLRELPCGEGVGRIALVEDREVGDEARVAQVGVEVVDVLGEEHPLVDHRPAAQRTDVEIGDVQRQHRLLDAPPDDVEVVFEPVVAAAAVVGDHDLLDLGPRRHGLFADGRRVHRHLPPAVDRISEIEDLGLDDHPAGLLRSQVGARQEHHADREAPAARRVPGVADVVLEDVLRDLHVDPGAVAGLAVGVQRAAVPDRLERRDARLHHPAPRTAVDGGDEPHAAGVAFVGGAVEALPRQAVDLVHGRPPPAPGAPAST